MDWLSKLTAAGANLAAVAGSKTLATLIGVDSGQLKTVLDALNQPTLCFIPILSEKLTVRRSADIGTTMLISQTDQTKEYITDNAAPRPRVWTGTGFISSLAPEVENGLWLKPSLLVQQSILEAAADSRQPVKFKTDTGEVVDVLISDLQITSTPKGAGYREITYAVQEVKILENSLQLGDISAALTTKAATKSIPLRAILNLGGNVPLYTGAAEAAISLLKTPAEVEEEVEEAQSEESGDRNITMTLSGQDVWSGKFTYGTFTAVSTAITDTDNEMQQTLTVGTMTFLLIYTWSEIHEAVYEDEAKTKIKTPAEYAWVVTIDSVVLKSEQSIPQRSFTMYPNTIHFDGDEYYTVSVISELENIGHADLPNVYITIGVRN